MKSYYQLFRSYHFFRYYIGFSVYEAYYHAVHLQRLHNDVTIFMRKQNQAMCVNEKN